MVFLVLVDACTMKRSRVCLNVKPVRVYASCKVSDVSELSFKDNNYRVYQTEVSRIIMISEFRKTQDCSDTNTYCYAALLIVCGLHRVCEYIGVLVLCIIFVKLNYMYVAMIVVLFTMFLIYFVTHHSRVGYF